MPSGLLDLLFVRRAWHLDDTTAVPPAAPEPDPGGSHRPPDFSRTFDDLYEEAVNGRPPGTTLTLNAAQRDLLDLGALRRWRQDVAGPFRQSAGIEHLLVLPVAGSWHRRESSAVLVVSTTTFGDERALLTACRG